MPQNITQVTATGTYSDSSIQNITTQVAWTVSDPSIATIGSTTGIVSIQSAGQIWGGKVGVTATLAPGTPGTASLIIVASDSGSVAPRMPLDDTQWQVLGLSPWGSYWGLQEPSGSMLISSGSTVIALTASVQAGAGLGPQMQSAEPGFLRNFIVVTGSAGMNYTWAGGSGPAMTSSIAFLTYAHVGMGAIFCPIVGVMRTNSTSVASITTDTVGSNTGQVTLDLNAARKNPTGPVSADHSDRVHPYLVVVNTSSMNVLAATDLGLITSASNSSMTFIADVNQKGFGGYSANGKVASASYCYFAVATGSTAESLSDPATAGAFLQSLGWSVPWASCPTDSGSIKLPYLPFHWTSLGLQPWTATWNMQEVAGAMFSNDVWPSTSWTAWSVTPSNSSYGYSLPGWRRVGQRWVEGVSRRASVVNAVNNSTFLLDPTGSFAALVYAQVSGSSAGAARQLMGVATLNTSVGSQVEAFIGPAPSNTPIVSCSGSTVTGSVNVSDGNVHPFLLVYDTTNSRVKLYTDKEAITGSFNAIQRVPSVTGTFGIGVISTSTPASMVSGVFNYTSFTTGALAESLSTDGVASSFLKKLGWTVAW